MAAKNYSREYKDEVLNHLRENDYSYYRTAKKFRISINTIKSWDDYPNNLPEKVQLRIKLNQLQRTKSVKKQARTTVSNPIVIEDLPLGIRELEYHAIKSALTKGIFLLDYISNPREYSEVTKTICKLIEIPNHLKRKPELSIDEILNELSKLKM